MTGGQPEAELKYTVRDPEQVERLLEDGLPGGLRSGAWRVVVVEDRYVDTADRALARAGYAARLRRTVGGTLIGLKTLDAGRVVRGGEGSSPALHVRTEHEAPATAALDPGEWPPSPVRDLVEELLHGAALGERFTLRQRRRERELRGRDGWALASLDEVDVRRRGRSLGRLTGLEIELRRGAEPLLAAIARHLEASGALEPETRTKEELAQALVDRQPRGAPRPAAASHRGRPTADRPAPAPAPAEERPARTRRSPQRLRPDDTLAEAGRKVLAVQLGRLRALEKSAGRGEKVEDVHHMRVATRRMRAAWRVFGPAYRRKVARRFVRRVRELARALGAVRDLDVLLQGIEEQGGRDSGDRHALEPFIEDLRTRREAARSDLARLLASDRYRKLIDEAERFTTTEGAGAVRLAATRQVRVRDTAATRIWKTYGRMRAYETVIEGADIRTLHALRISAKRLRYTLESFRDVLGSGADGLIEEVVALQDHLGELNDAHVAAGVAHDHLAAAALPEGDATAAAVAAYADGRQKRVTELRAGVGGILGQLLSPDFRRRLAEAVAIP